MPTYEYEGQKYELKDGLSNKEAKEKILSFVNQNRAGHIESIAAGAVSGLGKAAEGITTLGTTLIDLGVGTELTAKVEKVFDDSNFLNKVEDLADDRWTGKMTEVLTQLGVPGGVALKGANMLIKAKSAGKLSKFAGKMPTLTRMAAVGGAELAAKTEELGTLGNMGDNYGIGFTKERASQGETGRLEAIRTLENRFKFGMEGALGFGLFEKALIPLAKATITKAVPAVKGVFSKAGSGPNTTTKMVDEIDRVTKQPTGRKIPEVLQLEPGFQFNSNQIIRMMDWVGGQFRARGFETPKMFEASRKMIGEQRAAMETSRSIVRELENDVQNFIQPVGGALDDVGIQRREEIMENIYDFLTAPTGKKEMFSSKLPPELIEQAMKVRSHVDNLSAKLAENPLAQGAGDAFVRAVSSNIGEYLTRSYRAFGSETKKDWKNILYNTEKGEKILNEARAFIAKNDPEKYGVVVGGRYVPKNGAQQRMMEQELDLILSSKGMKSLGTNLVKLKSVDDAVFKMREQVPEPIRKLLGEIKDPSVQLLETSAKINNFLSSSKYFQNVAENGFDRYFFKNATATAGKQNFTTKIETDAWNPLNGLYTTPQIASAIHRVANTADTPGFIESVYNGILLAPKAIIQESKTTLSPITHLRNVSSALYFSGINGNLFNPRAVIKDFKRSYAITKGMTKSQLESQAGRKLFKNDIDYDKFLKEYTEMQRLGIVNTSARLGDLTRLMDDMSVGLESNSVTGGFYNVLKGFGKKVPGLRRLREGARTLYSAEDDFYKIQNYFSEQGKYRGVWDDLYNTDPNAFVGKYGNIARDKYGITDLFKRENYDKFIKETAADTVRNNIPNYDYVGKVIKDIRKLPFGNFVSFPAEILRTGINTTKQGIREWQDPLTRGIGMQRLAGVGVFGLGAGKLVEEGAQLISGVTNETVNSLKEFLPKWSENSTLIPIKQGGQVYFIDYSHSNAYDFLTRPFRAAMNAMNEGIENEEGALASIDNAAIEAGAEFLQPFFSESIITELYLDVFARGGEGKTGTRIWNPTDDIGTRVMKTIGKVAETAAPGSLNQFYRTYLSGVGAVQKYDRGYKFLNEASGLLGFRIQNPFIEQGLNFKISDNRNTLDDAKKQFTSVAYDGDSTPEQIIRAYEKANKIKQESDKKLFKRIEAARNLGMKESEIRKIIKQRLGSNEGSKIVNNRSIAFKVPDFVKKTIKQNAEIRNQPNPLRFLTPLFSNIYSNFGKQRLFDNPENLFQNIINFREEDRTPNITKESQSDAYQSSANQKPTNVVETVEQVDVSSIPTGTLSPGNRSQLAKSGNIDITEAIAERRT